MLEAMLKAKLKTMLEQVQRMPKAIFWKVGLEEPGLRAEELPDWGLFSI